MGGPEQIPPPAGEPAPAWRDASTTPRATSRSCAASRVPTTGSSGATSPAGSCRSTERQRGGRTAGRSEPGDGRRSRSAGPIEQSCRGSRTCWRPVTRRTMAARERQLRAVVRSRPNLRRRPMGRSLSVLGAPSSAGAYAPGQEKAPAAFRRHGLIEALGRARREVVDRGDVAGFRWRPDAARAAAMNLAAVRDTARAVAARTAAALDDGHDLLVLGGDCTVELGVVAGAIGRFASVGLIYIDGDTDLNPPEASDGALDWTGVAHLLDIPGATEELAGLGGKRPMLGSED